MSKRAIVAQVLTQLGTARALDALWGPHRLTVLAYHRIVDSYVPAFDFYAPNVSATPEMFARQMDYVARHFNVIALADLRAFVQDGQPLPPRPLLITFDDGYLDNYQNALPVLRQHHFPAVIFLMTDRMDHPARRAWWDACAYYFHHTQLAQADLPLIGPRSLADPVERRASREAFMTAVKQQPEDAKQQALDALPAALEVPPPPEQEPIFLDWSQVRELVGQGVACQPHTITHPILTRISPDEVQRQLAGSRDQVAQQTGQDVYAFAYPNGTPADYDQTAIRLLRETGYTLAFTLLDGPMRGPDVRQHPLEIQRIFLGHKDTPDLFVLKVMGLLTLRARPTFLS